MSEERRTAAVVTVGTELVSGISLDTNTLEITLALTGAGYDVVEAVSIGDDIGLLADALRRLTTACELVIVTGGLGPTHDDITREAASEALDLPLSRDERVVATLAPRAARHTDERLRDHLYVQAEILQGARVLPAVTGTAPGQVVPTARGELVLLPGPPREMRPMLHALAAAWGVGAAPPAVLRCTGVTESDAQMIASDVLAGSSGVDLTVLAALGDVRVVLRDRGVGEEGLFEFARHIASELGPVCYSTDGSSLAETVLRLAGERGVTLASAESCTGGLVSAALTDPPGSSTVFLGGVVTYSNEAKIHLLGVDPALIAALGAVSDAVAMSMASGARDHLGADLAVSVTGIAGPDGGSADKPVGTVWFGIAGQETARAELRRFLGDREAVRTRAAVTALDLLRRDLAGL